MMDDSDDNTTMDEHVQTTNRVAMQEEETMSHNSDHPSSSSDDDEIIDCPLFMTKLPRNFETNPHLAALASLIEENCDRDGMGKKKQGGKVKKTSSRKMRSSIAPYSKPQKDRPTSNYDKTKHSTSLGEAQLFLSMWKI